MYQDEWKVPSAKETFDFNPIFPVNLEDALDAVFYGVRVTKLGCCGSPHIRTFFIDKDKQQELRWITPAKREEVSKIDVHDIVAIAFGFTTQLFRKHQYNLASKEELSVAVKYKGKRGVITDLNIVFLNPRQMHLFVTGLQFIIMKANCGLVLAKQ